MGCHRAEANKICDVLGHSQVILASLKMTVAGAVLEMRTTRRELRRPISAGYLTCRLKPPSIFML
jgi:hypothetical protein